MTLYVCDLCGYVCDEAYEGKTLEELGDDWSCPICGAVKSDFRLLEQKAEAAPSPPAPEIADLGSYL